MNKNIKTDVPEYLNLEELGNSFFDWLIDIEGHFEEEQKNDALEWRLIKELCEANKIESFTWKPKDGLQFKVKRNG